MNISGVTLDYYSPEFKTELSKLDKNKTYLVYCGAGGRSSKTSKILKEQGCDSVYNLDHGFNNWDGPVEK
jgi:rhodanese-related sulfurtransferase